MQIYRHNHAADPNLNKRQRSLFFCVDRHVDRFLVHVLIFNLLHLVCQSQLFIFLSPTAFTIFSFLAPDVISISVPGPQRDDSQLRKCFLRFRPSSKWEHFNSTIKHWRGTPTKSHKFDKCIFVFCDRENCSTHKNRGIVNTSNSRGQYKTNSKGDKNTQ